MMLKRSSGIEQNGILHKRLKRTMLCLNLNEGEHYTCMFNKLDRMRREKKHCDFMIKFGSESLDAHRNILAAGSDYFDAMLSHDTKENRSGIVEMIDADAECVKICVCYIYGGKVEFSMDKCEQLMYVANLMQLQKVSDGIADLLEEKLDSRSYFATKRIAILFECSKLKEKCDKFAEENFSLISKTKKFGDLDTSYIKDMIKSKNVKMTEEVKLNVLLRWIRQDDERKKLIGEMLECVELGKVPLECLHHLLENEPLVNESFEIFRFLSTLILKAMKVGARPLGDDGEGILIFDGKSGFLQCFNPRANTLRQMQKMHEEMIKNYFSAVVLDDHIYALMQDKSVYRLEYSDIAATWEQMANMVEKHGWCPPAAVAAGQIYVIGGHFDFSTKAAEKYGPATDQWTRIVDRRNLSDGSELLTIGGNIYSFGGRLGGKTGSYVKEIERFDPLLSSWTDMEPMKKANIYAAAVELNGKVYVLGGANYEHFHPFDCYDADINEWTSLSPMKTERHCFRAYAVDGFIYAVGGYFSSPHSIEKYNVTKNEWEMVRIPSGMKLKIKESVHVTLK